ncbi:alginate lyase family protein [Candidatus Paracaedibacter symbiosus]|uniref:alginate lyase family protein n=1 Tax=Candidatus Paracaedibacter symbiosus TaxID=244582 RepID=UPI0005095CC7|nr:alginate lyase family protein [Candidatus Paracaedibacter symbiosus]
MFIERIRRILKKPLHYILWRLLYEAKAELARFWEPLLPSIISNKKIFRQFGTGDIQDLWQKLSQKEFCTLTTRVELKEFESATGALATTIFQNANKALNHQVTLLGLKDAFLGDDIDWGKDYKTGKTWPKSYFRGIDYVNFEQPSDVKIPWEISRMQWMLPLGQAYMLTGDEKYAQKSKDLIEDWIKKNPFTKGVNWACTMEVGIRIVVFSWFFHVFKKSTAWQDKNFQQNFIRNIYFHANFTVRHLEKSDINGNHYIADAMGLVFAGIFFGLEHKSAQKWMGLGWSILTEEIKKQIYADGVDYEGSIPYHRLVFEIFYFSARYASLNGVKIPHFYKEALIKAADFAAHYSQPDGSCPLVGDNDDGRILPFGCQDLNDHRYLTDLNTYGLNLSALSGNHSPDRTEIFWNLLPREQLNFKTVSNEMLRSKSYPTAGYYIMRHQDNHIFINCASLGLGGRGGHSHNDALSFEAVLKGEKLITDSGAYIYTADYQARNYFRSTAAHNTPYIPGKEINTMPGTKLIWSLVDEAKPECLLWQETENHLIFKGEHFGYKKLEPSLTVRREISLEKTTSTLKIEDSFDSPQLCSVFIPFHLDENVIIIQENNKIRVKKNNKFYHLLFKNSQEIFEIKDSWVSKSYGVRVKRQTLIFKVDSHQSFTLYITPE